VTLGRGDRRAADDPWLRLGGLLWRVIDLLEIDGLDVFRHADGDGADFGVEFVEAGLDPVQAGFEADDAEGHEEEGEEPEEDRDQADQGHPPGQPSRQIER
jgi:hypothetical protein